ncbi:hypothetical protein CPT03_01590 [Pedobacter ginsengisoli]|uniref:Uncharacterized protein n=1 Tax=Pedobacter ginsengisoli TaxID=363852 RepID=A0A2D1U0X0_9SPHI|nr:hypothetical protein [Pedobacter ginsengisoli]ATP55245.1 hypothetical protein CPT03_01590 [Pedobacter ginsengisoli]
MKEIFEFRVYERYYDLLSKPNKALFNGAVYIIKTTRQDPVFEELRKVDEYVSSNLKGIMFSYTTIKRAYSDQELKDSKLFHFWPIKQFGPTGEQCGTEYDDSVACDICGSGGRQISPLFLAKGKIPQKDISRTFGGEVIVSEKFVRLFKEKKMRGAIFKPVYFNKIISKFHQLIPTSEKLNITSSTVVGRNVFNAMPEYEKRSSLGDNPRQDYVYYKCPLGHLIGGNLISEPYVDDRVNFKDYDIFESIQYYGVRLNLLRPEPLYFCSPEFREMVIDEKLTGFDFQIARVK